MLAMLKFEVVDLSAASDSELVLEINTTGSTEAESELCRRLAPRLRLYGLRHLRDEQAAADLVQNVLLIMIESIRAGRLRDPENLASFGLGTCRMTVLDLRRGQRRRQELLDEFARTHFADRVAPIEPLDLLPLQNCLQRLPERERSVIVLSFYEDQSSDAVAGSLGLTSANARVIRHRALHKLRQCLEAV
jgi:RNA polymerase sigma-70 factor, ECF subfamily